MRLYLALTSCKQVIPFNYQSFVTGAIHKWIGSNNEFHGKPSLYSFSWLHNVDAYKNGLKTHDGSYFFISAHDNDLLKRILEGIQHSPEVCFGINVSEVQIKSTPVFSPEQAFFVASPVLIKKKMDAGQWLHLEYNDPEADKILTGSLQTKLKIAGLSVEGVQVSFDTTYGVPRTKIVRYKEIGNRVNLCPVRIQGSPEQIGFAWNVGVGNSTGIGFGALK
ncbi:MAG: CRISPR-associated endoribonuclease Cas6 [Chitinophagaceae bacterium]|nr:CRISPR-associated endoribonuclease Cas6 [Chitinophagaceae bacterium]